MSARFRPHLTYANVMSTIAVVLAVGTGGAYAANTIGSSDVIDESLLTQDIKNGQIARADVGNNAVASAEVFDSSLTGVDVQNSTLTGDDIVPFSMDGFHLRTGAISTREVAEGGLDAFDVGRAVGAIRLDFTSIAAGSCQTKDIGTPVPDIDGDTILVTADSAFSRFLSLTTLDSPIAQKFRVSACNPTGGAIDPASSLFAWLVFDN
jgi:hypothetical protein